MSILSSYVLLRWAWISLIGIALMTATYGVASAPSKPAIRLGLRGLKRHRLLQTNESWRRLEPLVRWLGVRLSGALSDSFRARINQQISFAGDFWGLTADEFVAASILTTILGLGAGIVLGAVLESYFLSCLVGVLLGALAPYLQMGNAADMRKQAVRRALPYAIDLMSLSMGAGLDFPGAVRQVVEKSSNPSDPVVEEFSLLLQSLMLGRTRKDALSEFSRRVPIESVKEFTSALIQAEERGSPIVEVLQIQAAAARMRKSVRAEEAASKAGVAMSGPVMLVFFCVLILILGPTMMGFKNAGL